MMRPTAITVTLPTGSTTTPAVELGNGLTSETGSALVGLIMPPELGGSILNGGSLTLQVSHDGVAFKTLVNAAGSVQAIAGNLGGPNAYPIAPDLTRPWRYIKLVASAATDIDLTFTLIQRVV